LELVPLPAFLAQPLNFRIFDNTVNTGQKSGKMETKFSDGTEKDQYVGEVETLLTHGWELDEEKIGLIKTYYFKTYTKCLVREADPHALWSLH
jgi:hypothetical protein